MFSLFHEIAQLDKFDGADFKYDNNIFKFEPQSMQIGYIWFQIKGVLFFAPNVAIRQLRGR